MLQTEPHYSPATQRPVRVQIRSRIGPRVIKSKSEAQRQREASQGHTAVQLKGEALLGLFWWPVPKGGADGGPKSPVRPLSLCSPAVLGLGFFSHVVCGSRHHATDIGDPRNPTSLGFLLDIGLSLCLSVSRTSAISSYGLAALLSPSSSDPQVSF